MKEIITGYYDWLKSNLEIKEIGDYFEEVTPFLDNRNDSISIYQKYLSNDCIQISDGGFIMDEFEILSIDVSKGKRKEVFDYLLSSYHIELKDGELITTTSVSNYYTYKHFFIQGILKLEDMYLLNRHTVKNTFQEDVLSFLDDNEITYSDDIKISGRSKLDHNIDILIPGKKHEGLIKLANNLDTNTVKANIFTFEDIIGARKKQSKFFVLINDKNSKTKKKYTDAFNQYDIKTLNWSDKKDISYQLENIG